jgi:hypothetical protein
MIKMLNFLAQSLPIDPATDFEAFARLVLDAVASGNGMLLVALALVGLTALARRFAGAKVPFLNTDVGGTLLAFALGFFGAVATALAAGEALSVDLLLSALKVTVAAIGGYNALKKLAVPALMQAKAKAAGDVAVKSAPAQGVAGVVGKIDEVQ